MNEEELVCEYCRNGISLDDKKCPSCGADCTKTVNRYKKQRQEIEDKRNERVLSLVENSFKNINGMFKINYVGFIITFAIIIFAFIFVIGGISSSIKNRGVSSFFENEEKEKVITVKYNEMAKTSKFNVILDEYEPYNYVSDQFSDLNTPNGYKKVAFHFKITNNTDEDLYTFSDLKISATADDYALEEADLEVGMFCYVTEGKEKYSELPMTISSGSSIQGYVGYLVPSDAKVLKFKVGSVVNIEMENPVFSE